MAFYTNRSLFLRSTAAHIIGNTVFRYLLILGITQLALLADGRVSFGQQAGSMPVKKISTQLRGFGVPFAINADDTSYIEVQLFVTKDEGKTWQFHGRQATDSEEFPFQADEDGEYWFALKTLDKDRRLIPDGQIQPELKIVVDTVKPRLTFNTDTDSAGRVVCSWDARDQNLDPDSFKIRYRNLVPSADSDTAWLQVPLKLNSSQQPGVLRDQIAWWPESSGTTLQVRVEVADQAGNMVAEDRIISVPTVAWRNKSSSTANLRNKVTRALTGNQAPGPGRSPPPFQPETMARQTASTDSKVICEGGVCRLVGQNQPDNSNHFVKHGQTRPDVGSLEEWGEPPPPPLEDVENSRGQVAKSATTSNSRSQESQQNAKVKRPNKAQAIHWPSETEDPVGLQSSVVSSTLNQNSQPQPDLERAFSTRPRASEVMDKLAQSKFRKLPGGMFVSESTALQKPNYQPMAQLNLGTTPEQQGRPVASGNPASDFREKTSLRGTQQVGFGVGERVPKSPILSGPELKGIQSIRAKRFNLDYGIDSIDPSGVKKVVLWMTRDGGQNWKSWSTDPDGVSPFPVEVDEAGTYGFRIVVQSRDGLTGLTPRRGDQADVYINIDTEAPLAQIKSVPYGRGNEAGRLVINWTAEDPNLTLRPITLSYSTAPSGPWSVIDEGLRNTGRYVWQVGPNVPEKVFLRLEARDQAGNVGVFQLKQMIDISGLVPRGRIRGVRPVSN